MKQRDRRLGAIKTSLASRLLTDDLELALSRPSLTSDEEFAEVLHWPEPEERI